MTIASAPLGDRTAEDIDLIWASSEAEYFWKWDWTGQISLIQFNKFRRARKCRSPEGANGSQ
jgi:hypothetical protein